MKFKSSSTALLLSWFMQLSVSAYCQKATIKGRVFDASNNEAIAFANIVVDSNSISGTTSDINGNFIIDNLTPGSHNITCTYVGYQTARYFEIIVSPVKPTTLDIALTQEISGLQEIVVKADGFDQSQDVLVSKQTVSATEIYRNPGGNRDISKVVQILPGVASGVSFRNDLIVRGGAPNENRFYLDGIEVPNINHFATQGSSGGPNGMINVNFIREVDFYAGGFPVNRGNALSSVMEFQQISGNDEKLSGTFMVGSSDIGLTLEGPATKNSTFIFSIRRSYLQFLFEALSLPFLPTYNDAQMKYDWRIGEKNRLSIIGLGSFDDFVLNEDVNNGITDTSVIQRNQYLLGNLPVNKQWSYAIGANWKHFSKNSFQTIVVSRNHLKNTSIKYKNNIETPANLLLDYSSQEVENKVRLENERVTGKWTWNYGLGYENVYYSNSTYIQKEINGFVIPVRFSSELTFNKFAAFGRLGHRFLNNRVLVSLGLRTDFNDYSPEMSNPLDQLSGRLGVSVALTEKLNFNTGVGNYYQLPPYTTLGYRDSLGVLENKNNGITYIECRHVVAGFEFRPTEYSRLTLEGFQKFYNHYPFLLRDSISLANLGADFGVIGNEPAVSISEGRSYGLEFMFQQKLSQTIYGILSYTFVRSEFKDKHGNYVPSAWDNRHILNITAGKKFNKGWEVGMKFRMLGGAPYTPYDVGLSSQKEVWDATGTGIPDWDQLNQKRNSLFHSLDMRVDKKWFFKKWSLNTYLDIQNLYNAEIQSQPFLDVVRDNNGNPVTDPNDPSRYQVTEIENNSGTVLPSIGIMIEF